MNQEYRTCVRCLYDSRHPLGLSFDEYGECSGCVVHRQKQELDWAARQELLQDIVDQLPRDSDYDCVVPVRGTPEYFDVLDVLVNKWGLRVLVAQYNHQFNSRAGIRNLALMRQRFDVDFVSYTSNPQAYRVLVREAIVRLGSVQWPAICGASSFPVTEAVYRRIPLVIWPTHQATEQVGAHSYLEQVEMSRMGRHGFDLMGREPEDLVESLSKDGRRIVHDLRYPSDVELEGSGVRGIYLSNFYPWDSRRSAERGVDIWGAEAAPNPRTFDTYDRIDDLTYMGLHDYLKVARCGYGRVTDSLVQEMRFGRVSRDVAEELRAYYAADSAHTLIGILSRWLSVDEVSLAWIVQYHANELGFVEEDQTLAALSRMFRTQTRTTLSEEAQQFVAGYRRGNLNLASETDFTLVGKGLHLTDLERLQHQL